MSFEELALFQIWSDRSWPFITDFKARRSDNRQYGRRVINPVFSQVDASLVSFEDSGETATILSSGFSPGLIVLCARINHQWFAIRPAWFATQLIVVPSGVDAGDERISASRTSSTTFQPVIIELITTGSVKSVIDGVYQLVPKHNGNGTRMTASNKGCIGLSGENKAGASILMEATPTIDSYGNGNYNYEATITHSDITTTVYNSSAIPLTIMSKKSGDARLPDDIRWLFGAFSFMPLWFNLESDDDDITGLYTLWPGYFDEEGGTWSAPSKNFIHAEDGTRKVVTYSASYFGGAIDFRIQITVPSGGALRYNCDLDNWSNENGAKMTFNLESNTSSASAPDTLSVLRPDTGYAKTPNLEDQFT